MISQGKKKKIILGATAGLLVLICLSVWFLYAGSSIPLKTVEEPAALVRTMVIAPENVDQRYTYAGEVRGRYESHLAFQVGGKVVSRNVELGSIVRPGQTLLEIDARDIAQAVNIHQAQVDQARSQLQLAEQDLKRYRLLVEQDVVSRSRFEQVQTAYDVARAALERAQAQYRQGTNQFDYTKLKADKAGVVSAVTAEVGQVVGSGQVVVSVVRDGEREIEISVPENRIDAIRSSSLSKITFWALPKVMIEGKIRELAPMADAVSRTYKVRVALLQQPTEIRLGMTASVRITDQNGALATPYIPLSALYQTGKIPQVWVVQNSVAHLRTIETGGFNNDQVQVLSGLKPGDIIATAGVHKLRDGQKVKAVAGE